MHRHEHTLVNKYISRHYNKPIEELNGYEILNNIMDVFGYNEHISIHIIIEYFHSPKVNKQWFKENATPLINSFKLIDRLKKARNLDGLSGFSGHANDIVRLYNNQLNETYATKPVDISAFETISFPMVRRVFARTINLDWPKNEENDNKTEGDNSI